LIPPVGRRRRLDAVDADDAGDDDVIFVESASCPSDIADTKMKLTRDRSRHCYLDRRITRSRPTPGDEPGMA
jgi:hypothetical protein